MINANSVDAIVYWNVPCAHAMQMMQMMQLMMMVEEANDGLNAVVGYSSVALHRAHTHT
jgi:hypothetical protein